MIKFRLYLGNDPPIKTKHPGAHSGVVGQKTVCIQGEKSPNKDTPMIPDRRSSVKLCYLTGNNCSDGVSFLTMKEDTMSIFLKQKCIQFSMTEVWR